MDLSNLALSSIFFVGLVTVGLLVWDLLRTKKTVEDLSSKRLEELEREDLDKLSQAYETAHQISSASYQQAQDLIAQAQREAASLLTKSQVLDSYFDQTYQKLLEEKVATILQDFEKQLMGVDGLVTQRLNTLFENFEAKLSTQMLSAQNQSIKSIELELRSARNLIDTYKAQQLQLIDENIVAMLEKTLSMVIAKKLTLKDQLDLVYEALEKAKVEKFIV